MVKKCETCGKPFNPGKHLNTKNCSKECLKIYNSLHKKERSERSKDANPKKDFFNICVTCGKSFNRGRHAETMNCSEECRKIYKDLHKDERMQATRDSLMKKYGVDHPSKIEGFYDKVRATKKENHGSETYNNEEQRKKTTNERYGVDFAMQKEEVRNKVKKTKKEKHGDENYNNNEKARQTTFEKTGKYHHLQTKESMDKQRETNLKLHGTEYTLNIDKCRDNAVKITKEKYGVDYYFSSDEHNDKARGIKKRL